MEDRLEKLPKGWVWTTFEGIASNDKNAIVDGPFGSNLKLSDYIDDENGVPVLTTKNFEYGYGKQFVRYISKDKFQELRRSEVKGGDILVAKIGSCGKVSIYPENLQSAMIPANLLKMTVHPEIKKLYVFHFINSPFFKRALENITTATAQPAFNVTKFRKLPIPLPPLPEHHRIVAKIEELFTRLDAGIEALKKIKAQLKRYRQAVLKYAFEGKLTQEWREANKGKIEPASALLERIREERKKEAKGKFKELPPVDTSELPELPEGWVWITFSQLISPLRNSIKRGPFGSAVKKAFFVEKGFKVYEQQNAIYDNPRLGNYYINEDKFNELIGFEVKPGDFIVSCSGTIGKITQLPHNAERGIINQALLKLTIDSRLVAQKFFLECFRSNQFQTKLLKETRGSAMKNINSVEDIKIIPIALPPLVEQQKILEEIDSRLSVADELEKVAEKSLKQSDRLRRSILKRAFEGKLVPQDPTDEPADKLLGRINEEKVKREGENKREKKHRNRNSKQMELI